MDSLRTSKFIYIYIYIYIFGRSTLGQSVFGHDFLSSGHGDGSDRPKHWTTKPRRVSAQRSSQLRSHLSPLRQRNAPCRAFGCYFSGALMQIMCRRPRRPLRPRQVGVAPRSSLGDPGMGMCVELTLQHAGLFFGFSLNQKGVLPAQTHILIQTCSASTFLVLEHFFEDPPQQRVSFSLRRTLCRSDFKHDNG